MTGILTGLLERGTDTDSNQQITESQARQIIKGLVTGNEQTAVYTHDHEHGANDDDEGVTITEWLSDPVEGSCYITVTAPQLRELENLPQFNTPEFDGQNALRFAKQFDEDVVTMIEIKYYRTPEPELTIQLRSVQASGELSNDIVESFIRNLSRSIHAVCDPMAEDHNEPTLRIQF